MAPKPPVPVVVVVEPKPEAGFAAPKGLAFVAVLLPNAPVVPVPVDPKPPDPNPLDVVAVLLLKRPPPAVVVEPKPLGLLPPKREFVCVWLPPKPVIMSISKYDPQNDV